MKWNDIENKLKYMRKKHNLSETEMYNDIETLVVFSRRVGYAEGRTSVINEIVDSIDQMKQEQPSPLC